MGGLPDDILYGLFEVADTFVLESLILGAPIVGCRRGAVHRVGDGEESRSPEDG